MSAESVLPVALPMCGQQGNTAPSLYVDVAALLDGGLPEPPAPVLLRRTDEVCLFYDGQVNLIFGDPETGKSLLVTAAAAEALRAGRRVLWIDMDHNGVSQVVERLLSFGAPEYRLRDLDVFRYVEPEDETHLRDVILDVKQGWHPDAAVVDSVGELLPMLRLGSNSPDDFTVAHSRVLKPLALAGAVVLAVDHLAKNTESRLAGPTGTAAKRRAVGGVSLRVVVASTFIPGVGGGCHLYVNKDRPGGLRRRCPAPESGKGEQYAGTFSISVDDVGLTRWQVKAPSDVPEIPSSVNRADLDALASLDPSPTSVRDVADRLHWRTARASAALKAWRQRCQALPGNTATR